MEDSDSDEESWKHPAELSCLSKVTFGGTDHQRSIIHIDMDCFYAQVEMLRKPYLRDKPIGVQQKSLLATTNYKARELGVKKMMSLQEAKSICPDLVLVNGEDLTPYREMSYRISDFCLKYTPRVERLGFDENFLDVTDLVTERMSKTQFEHQVSGFTYGDRKACEGCHCGCDVRLKVASHVAAEIRSALYNELGLTCCAGIAHNKLLSKLVAGQHKPNQQTTLFPGQVAQFITSLTKPGTIPGIGHATSKKLSALGINNLSDLQNTSLKSLIKEFGETMATSIQQLAYGIDNSPVVPFSLPQTLSDEDSFRNCSCLPSVYEKIDELLTNLLKRLLADGRIPHTFRLTVRKGDSQQYGGRESRQCPISSDLFKNFNSENLDKVHQRLCEIAASLFHKLVNVKETFNIVLINVAFTKMETRTKHSINRFFSEQMKKNGQKSCGQFNDRQSSSSCQSKFLSGDDSSESNTTMNLSDTFSVPLTSDTANLMNTISFSQSFSAANNNNKKVKLFQMSPKSNNLEYSYSGKRKSQTSLKIDSFFAQKRSKLLNTTHKIVFEKSPVKVENQMEQQCDDVAICGQPSQQQNHLLSANLENIQKSMKIDHHSSEPEKNQCLFETNKELKHLSCQQKDKANLKEKFIAQHQVNSKSSDIKRPDVNVYVRNFELETEQQDSITSQDIQKESKIENHVEKDIPAKNMLNYISEYKSKNQVKKGEQCSVESQSGRNDCKMESSTEYVSGDWNVAVPDQIDNSQENNIQVGKNKQNKNYLDDTIACSTQNDHLCKPEKPNLEETISFGLSHTKSELITTKPLPSKEHDCKVIPNNIDPHIFSSLPLSLQKELLLEWEMQAMKAKTKPTSPPSNRNTDTLLRYFRPATSKR